MLPVCLKSSKLKKEESKKDTLYYVKILIVSLISYLHKNTGDTEASSIFLK